MAHSFRKKAQLERIRQASVSRGRGSGIWIPAAMSLHKARGKPSAVLIPADKTMTNAETTKSTAKVKCSLNIFLSLIIIL